MRSALLYNPRLLLERLADASLQHRRIARLRGTIAQGLNRLQIDALELLDIAAQWPVRVIYDIGAHVGGWTRLAKAIIPTAEVHAFEPLGEHADAFHRETTCVPNVKLHQVALGSRPSAAAPFHLAVRTDESSFLPPTNAISCATDTARHLMPLVRLDDYIPRANVPPPDLMKLDVQGFELEVLNGGRHALAHATAVICEVSFIEFYKGQPLFADLATFLNEHQFVPHAFARTMPTGRPLGQTDVLFVRRDML